MGTRVEREVSTLGNGADCCSWNYCGQRLAVGYNDGTVAIHDSLAGSASKERFARSFKWQAHESGVLNIEWVPPEFGDAVCCICTDGPLSLWEEVEEATQPLTWNCCKVFESSGSKVLAAKFGVSSASLKLAVAYADGQAKVYELMDPLDLNKWQLQAEFQNVVDSVARFGRPSCTSACIAWIPGRGESQHSSFVLAFNSDLSQFNTPKIWEFDDVHQRWLPAAELALPEDERDGVNAVAWSPNIGRPYELIAVATCKGIAIWHVGTSDESEGGLSTDKIALLSGHNGEVWQLEWDMSGMTLASTGSDMVVRLWQSNLNGVWQEQASLECSGTQ